MNKFDYYANDVIMESASYNELLALKKEFNEKYSGDNLDKSMSEVINMIQDEKFNEAKKKLDSLKEAFNFYYNKVKNINTTVFDNIRSNMKGKGKGHLLVALPAALYAFAKLTVASDSRPSKKEIGTITVSSLILQALMSVGDQTTIHKDLKNAEETLGEDASGNVIKNALLILIKSNMKAVEDMEKIVDDIKRSYLAYKKKYPNPKNKRNWILAALDDILQWLDGDELDPWVS